jgi:hypothetical protein
MQQQQIERERIAAQQQTEGAKTALQMMNERHKLDKSHEIDGTRAGLELTKHREQLSHQERIANLNAARTANQQTSKPKPKSKGD